MRLKVFLVFLLSMAASAQAWEFAAGVAGVEEGDDRYRPALSVHLGLSPQWYMRHYQYGRELGPYTETTYVDSFNYRFLPTPYKTIHAGFGFATLVERAEEKEASSSSQFNAGFAFGLAYQVPIERIYVGFHWDAHLFLAGSSGILLATGRKQSLGITTGVRF